MSKLAQKLNSLLDEFLGSDSYGFKGWGHEYPDDTPEPAVLAEETSVDSKTKPQETQLSAKAKKPKTVLWDARRSSDLVFASRFSSQFPLPLKQPRKNKGQDYVRVINDWVYRLISSSDYGPPTVVDWLYLAILEDKARKTKSRTVSIDSIWEVVSLISDDGGSGYKRFVKGLLRWFHCKFIVGPNGDPGAMVAWDFFEAINIKGFTKKWEPSKGNIAVFTEKHFQRIMEEEAPYDLEVLRHLTHSPGALAMYLFVSQRAYKIAKDKEGVVHIGAKEFLKQIGTEAYGRERDARLKLKKWKSECDKALMTTGTGHLPLDINQHGVVSIFPKELLPGVHKLPSNEKPIGTYPKLRETKPKASRKTKEFDFDWVLEKELKDYNSGKIESLSQAASRYSVEKHEALTGA